ncbi:transmembrane amino acid transporter protein-domain-containing protein, partial [Sporodiniella umbellata]
MANKTKREPQQTNVQNEKQESVYEASICEEQIEHAPQGTASSGKALFMLLKAFIGTGIIFLPKAFSNGGLVLSIILMFLIGSICLVSFRLLVEAQQKVGGSYGDVAQHLYGLPVKILINIFICLAQMGIGASYMMFISQNIDIVVRVVNHCTYPFESKYYMWIVVIPVICFCLVRRLARLSWIVIVADVFIAFNLICVIYFSSKELHDNSGMGANVIMVNQKDFALMIGTAVFSYEGIGMIVPVVEGMKHPEKFPRVLNQGIIISTIVFTLIGAIGYVAYGDVVQASVVTNIGTSPLATTVRVLYSCAIILSAPFMLYPAVVIFERLLIGTRSGQKHLAVKWVKNAVRASVPLICAAVSFGVGADNLDKFVSLVGSIACVPLCFTFPGLFHYKITENKYLKMVDIALIVWGLGIMVYTTYINVDSWVHPAIKSSVVFTADGCAV